MEKSNKPSSQSTPKLDELNDKINLENEILAVLYKQKELNQLTEYDRAEINKRNENLEKITNENEDHSNDEKIEEKSKKFAIYYVKKLRNIYLI